MAYHTSVYLFLFLPAALLAYQLTPKKKRWVTLVLCGYFFFWMISKKLIVYLFAATLITHYIGVWLQTQKDACRIECAGLSGGDAGKVKKQYKKKERRILAGGVLLLLAILAYLKYYNFFAENVNFLLQNVGDVPVLETKKLLLPIGISFYTLQAIGYMADVYWGKFDGRQPLGKVALFLAFFPQIMEGPISLYSQTADVLWEGKTLEWDNLTGGGVRIIWGLFKKMVIADRLYVPVQAIFVHYEKYHGAMIAFAAVAYTVQLYMEFSGCMDIIIGSGRMFGVKLPENFRQPFASRNAAEFWRRWHITLGVWFKTYIFYPVSVSTLVKKWNRFGKAHLGKYLTKLGVSAFCLFPVWLCNGLWHGARWSYIFYGMYYFVILFAEVALEPVREKVIKNCHLNEQAFYVRIPRILKTWLIIFVGELFFRADTLTAGFVMFRNMFRDFHLRSLCDGTLLAFGLDQADYLAIICGCAVVFIVGIIKERNLLGEEGIGTLCLPVRWALYYSLILALVIFGAYGAGYQQVDMIYAGF